MGVVAAKLQQTCYFLFKRFGWEETNFYLLDGDSGHEQICHTHEKVGRDYYNSLQATRDFCLANGIEEKHLFLLNAEEEHWKSSPVRYDLCYSFKAIGFHWPVTGYLDALYPLLKKGACLVFEIRPSRDKCLVDFNERQIRGVKREQYEIRELSMEPRRSIMVLERR